MTVISSPKERDPPATFTTGLNFMQNEQVELKHTGSFQGRKIEQRCRTIIKKSNASNIKRQDGSIAF